MGSRREVAAVMQRARSAVSGTTNGPGGGNTDDETPLHSAPLRGNGRQNGLPRGEACYLIHCHKTPPISYETGPPLPEDSPGAFILFMASDGSRRERYA